MTPLILDPRWQLDTRHPQHPKSFRNQCTYFSRKSLKFDRPINISEISCSLNPASPKKNTKKIPRKLFPDPQKPSKMSQISQATEKKKSNHHRPSPQPDGAQLNNRQRGNLLGIGIEARCSVAVTHRLGRGRGAARPAERGSRVAGYWFGGVGISRIHTPGPYIYSL